MPSDRQPPHRTGRFAIDRHWQKMFGAALGRAFDQHFACRPDLSR
jgi:hypothetical protein